MKSKIRITSSFKLLFILWHFSFIYIHGAKPNLVFILNDDMGYGDLEANFSESKIPTPEMNRLVEEGIRFTDAHSPNSICTPTRYGLLTGRHSWRTGYHGIVWQFGPPVMNKDRLTFPDFLKSHGYATAIIGKWHLGMDWPTVDGSNPNRTQGDQVDFTQPITEGPITRGFDYYYGTAVPNFPPYVYIENDKSLGIPNIKKPSGMHGYAGVMLEGHDLVQILPNLMNKSIEWMESHVGNNPDQPFFLYFSNTGPHVPVAPIDRFIGTTGAHLYGDFVAQIDWVIGQLDSTLIRLGVSHNTLLIVSSDNGSRAPTGDNMAGPYGSVTEVYGHDPSGGLRGRKLDIYEGGHRVPFIAKWPGVIQAGSISNDLISLTDIYATMAEILNQPIPVDAAEDSYNVLPAFLKLQIQNPGFRIFQKSGGAIAIRKDNWKYIPEGQYKQDSGLYDLDADLKEEFDVQASNQAKVQELTALFQDHFENSNRSAPVLIPGSDSRIKRGCMNPGYLEFDGTANVHDELACKTLSMAKKIQDIAKVFIQGNNLTINLKEIGVHEIIILDVSGKILKRKESKGPLKYVFSDFENRGLYMLKINTALKTYSTRIPIY